MSRVFQLDYDEGVWILNIDLGSNDINLRMYDDEAFELLDALRPVVERRDTYEKYKAEARGAMLAGFFNEPDPIGIED